MIDGFSNYIVYVDESGDHNLQNLDPNYPVFVLAFCIFHKSHYTSVVAPKLQTLKFHYFGYDLVVLHENEIRKEKPPFNIFTSRQQRDDFLNQITKIIDESNFILVACVIEKKSLNHQYQLPGNPYNLALGFGLERVYRFLQEKCQDNKKTHIVVERRGRKEDNELELEFRRICDGANWFKKPLPFTIQFANKTINSTGLQLADLIARPVGLHILRPNQNNRSFEILRSKFYCRGGRMNVGNGYEGWGLKRFP
jgi:hypothetical protein